MFGLMRAKKCGMSGEEKEFRRLNYCGTCKTIGSLYGQKSRFLLNHDTVFLAEVLSALGGENISAWQDSYLSYNCLNLPPESEMPFSLKFAATTNIILTEFKLADHISDENKRRHKFARNAFSKEFIAAEKLLTEWDFPLGEVREILQTQAKIELEQTSLDALAFPTAQTTAVFFREGARLSGKAELETGAFKLGFAFGKLIYLLDAFEDYEKDFRAGQFNAFSAAFDLKESRISAEIKRRIATILQKTESKIISEINDLPIPENQKKLFVSRLSQNLQRKLKTNLPVLKEQKSCAAQPKQTFTQRWQNAAEKARNLARQYRWQMPLVFLFIFVFALAAPAQTRDAKSARECFDLGFNLMFLGAVFGSVLAFPKTVLMQNLPTENIAEKAERKRREGWCDSCNCGDCCGEGFVDACCCGCENCDCGCDGCCCGCDSCSCD